ncbi:unnamed protein product [Nezara viridula]|uniref:Uncharacterized protein n=1 Tax=Nezara viridula TaxID=85310 RepID=A0A9P0HLA1_NEZVI|nr:unnamed protein product [Nezara viridula]
MVSGAWRTLLIAANDHHPGRSWSRKEAIINKPPGIKNMPSFEVMLSRLFTYSQVGGAIALFQSPQDRLKHLTSAGPKTTFRFAELTFWPAH